MRVHLRSPAGETVVRGIRDGIWAEDVRDPDASIGERSWAIPGLVDAHSHLAGDAMPHEASPTDIDAATKRAVEALKSGVTLLFDKGWSDETVLDLIDELDPAKRPHIEAAGKMISTPGGYYHGFGTEIDPDDIGEAVARAIGGRADWVKLIGDWPRPGVGPHANFTQTQLEAAVRTAEAQGARVAIHTMAREVPSIAVAAGVHSIEHGLFLEESDLSALAGRGGMWVPTLRQVEATAGMLRPGSSGETLLLEGVANASRLLPIALEAGVTVLPGSDLAFSAAEVVEEVLRMAQCGLDAPSVLRVAAGAGHEAAGGSSNFAVGTRADAVLLPENPLNDLNVLRHPARVIRKGTVLR